MWCDISIAVIRYDQPYTIQLSILWYNDTVSYVEIDILCIVEKQYIC